MSICPLGSYPCHHVRKEPSPASYLVIDCAQSKWMTAPSPCIPSYGKMKLLALPIFGNEQNKINLLRFLCQSRGVPIWLKDDSNTPKGSCSLGVLEQCHPEKKLGCNLHHQDPIFGTYHYFYYLQVKSWNFRKLEVSLRLYSHQMVSALSVSALCAVQGDSGRNCHRYKEPWKPVRVQRECLSFSICLFHACHFG